MVIYTIFKIGSSFQQDTIPYFMLSAAVLPSLLTIDLAGDMGGFRPGSGALDPNNYNSFGGVRFSSDLADLLTLDVIYRIHGDDPNIVEGSDERSDPDGCGRTTHVASLVTRLHLIDTVGITFGCSVLVTNYEDHRAGNTIHSHRVPVLHGLDLRLNLNFIDALSVTLNNNVTFSNFRGTNDNTTHDHFDAFVGVRDAGPQDSGTLVGIHRLGNIGTSNNNEDVRHNYFAMYNTLGVRFMLGDSFGLNFHLQNTMRRFHLNNEAGSGNESATRFQNQFIGQAVAEYGLTTNVLVGGGFGSIFNSTSLNISTVMKTN